MKNSEDLPVSTHANADCTTQDGTLAASRFDALKIPVSIAIGFLLGETIGKNMGAGYAGFGQISGSRIGEWIGFAVGISAAVVVVGLFMTKAQPARHANATRTFLRGSYLCAHFLVPCGNSC